MAKRKSKHTPGPWQTSQDDERGVYADGGAALVATLHTVTLPERDQPDRQAVTKANASLIAAAPELLEACEVLVAIDDQPPENRLAALLIAIERGRDAIAKAKGE